VGFVEKFLSAAAAIYQERAIEEERAPGAADLYAAQGLTPLPT
jgi:hypothetical protein